MSDDVGYLAIETPVGELLAIGSAGRLVSLHFNGDGAHDARKESLPMDRRGLAEVERQLGQYFSGERTHFELKLDPAGTEFQRAVWMALRQIPFGETRSYGEIAAAVGNPQAARAVGGANNKNPIPVIVPCHRVIGAGGAMVGFAGGLDRKTWLLDHERSVDRSAYSSS